MIWMRWGSLAMLCGVALGAFGAHGLKAKLSAEAMLIYHTAVFYHLIHGLGLLALGWVSLFKPMNVWVRHAGCAFLVGILLFSGSLYLLSVTGVKKWGAMTPFGGLAFLYGWLCLLLAAQ